MTTLSRRTALAGLGLTLAAPAILRPGTAAAKAKMMGPDRPTHFRFPVGKFEVTTIFDGRVQLKGPHPIFGQDQTPGDVAKLAEANNLPSDRMEIGFTPTLVNTGKHLILFDTGNDATNRPTAGKLRERMKEAGYKASDVDIVVITHMHPDHIGGMRVDGKPAFPNARYVTSAREYDHWVGKAENELALKMVKPFAEEMTFIEDGGAVVSGVEAIAANGHTPGHNVYHVESEGERLLIVADLANHYVMSLERPDWHVKFDMDKEAAAQTRRTLLDMLAAEKMPFVGYHMPWPGIGYVEKSGDGYAYAPHSYQLLL